MKLNAIYYPIVIIFWNWFETSADATKRILICSFVESTSMSHIVKRERKCYDTNDNLKYLHIQMCLRI